MRVESSVEESVRVQSPAVEGGDHPVLCRRAGGSVEERLGVVSKVVVRVGSVEERLGVA